MMAHVSGCRLSFKSLSQASRKTSLALRPTGLESKRSGSEEIDSLYRRIGGFLKESVDAGFMTLDFREVELTEDYLGTYSTGMNVKIGKRQTVSLTPVGTLSVGCRGKVLAEGSVRDANCGSLRERQERNGCFQGYDRRKRGCLTVRT